MKFLILFCSFLLFFQIACAQKSSFDSVKQDNTQMRAIVKTQAEELGKALLSSDFEKLLSLMHQTARKKIPDEKKFIEGARKWIEQTEAEGFKLVAVEVSEPQEIIKIDTQLFAVLPTKLRIKTPQGLFVQDSFDIAISDDAGKTWKFAGVGAGSGSSKERFKELFPIAASKLELPQEKPPVAYQEPKN